MVLPVEATLKGIEGLLLPPLQDLAVFDGFERIGEGDLPKVIDTLHIADASSNSNRVFGSRMLPEDQPRGTDQRC